MLKYLVLTSHNMRKYRGQFISFLLVVVLAAGLLNIGLVTLLNNKKNYIEKLDQYQCADIFFSLNDVTLSEKAVEIARGMAGVNQVETRRSIMMSGEASYGDTGSTLRHIFFDLDEQHSLNRLEPVGETLDFNKISHPAYVSYWIKTSGCSIGDQYQYESNGMTYTFTIAGFVEDLMYGNNNCGNLAVYLPEKEFDTLYSGATDTEKAFTLSLTIGDRADSKKLHTQFMDQISGSLTSQTMISDGYYDKNLRLRTLTASITASMIVFFSVLLTLVTLILINFRIKYNIQEEMQNMGILKAMGYSSKQVVTAVALPYLLLTVVSVVSGIGLSYLLFPVVNAIFEQLTGLIFAQGFDSKSAVLVAGFIVGLVFCTALISARRIKRLHPVVALRSGIRHHSFRKNLIPLQNLICNIHLGMALKNFCHYYKQNVFLTLILFVMTFIGVFAGSGMYNTVMESEKFINAFSEENPSVSITARTHEASELIRNSLSTDERVQKVIYYDQSSLKIEDENISLFIIDEYDKLENDLCYAGRNPLHDNEIVIGNGIAEQQGLGIGDEITVKYQEESHSYLIVGLLQALDYNGKACEMTKAGFAKLDKGFEPTTLFIYLQKDSKSNIFLKDIQKTHGDGISSFLDYDKLLEQVFGGFAALSAMVVCVIVIIVVLVITVVLYMILKTMIINRRQELGILKAVGYSSRQLIFQQAYSMLPSTILGAAAGGIAGKLLINQTWLLCFYSLGIRKADLQIPVLWVVAIGAVIAFVTFALAILMSGRIKRVHAIELIKE